jgi:hypothetical protein
MVLDNTDKVGFKFPQNCLCSNSTKSKAISNPIKHKQISQQKLIKGIAIKCDIHKE